MKCKRKNKKEGYFRQIMQYRVCFEKFKISTFFFGIFLRILDFLEMVSVFQQRNYFYDFLNFFQKRIKIRQKTLTLVFDDLDDFKEWG